MPLLYAIGLGGTGGQVIVDFAKKFRSIMKEAEEKGIRLGVKFQIIDLAREPSIDNALKEGILTPDDVYIIPGHIVEQEKNYLPVLADIKKDWFPPELKYDIPYRIRGEHGVERRRCVARLILHDPEVSWQIYNVLVKDIEELVEARAIVGSNVLYVVIVASLGGGWGSGTFIDIAAIVRHIVNRVSQGAVTPIIIGVLIVPYGYATIPPPAIRVEYEEENAMAAIYEVYLLHILNKLGLDYQEEIGRIGRIEYASPTTKPLDIVFLVSYKNVAGATYQDQYEKIDSILSDFLAFLALMPSTSDELRRMEQIVTGITLSENILSLYEDTEKILPLPRTIDEVLKPRWRPLVLTFGIAEKGINLFELSKLFEKRKLLEDYSKKIEELTTRSSELKTKLAEFQRNLVETQTNLSLCLDKAVKILRGEEEYQIPQTIINIINDLVNIIEADPVAAKHRGDVKNYINRITSELKDNVTLQYLALRYLEQKVRDLERKYSDRVGELREKLKMIERDLDSNIKIYQSMPLYKRLLEGKKVKEHIDKLHREKSSLINEISVAEGKLDGIRMIRDDVGSIVSTLSRSAKAEDLCQEYASKLSSLRKSIEDYEREQELVNIDIKSAESLIKNLKYDIDKMLKEPTLSVIRTTLGDKFIEKLYEIWSKDSAGFVSMTISDVNEIVKEELGYNIFTKFADDLSLSSRTLLSETSETLRCYQDFFNEYLRNIARDVSRGIKILIASPKDVSSLAEKLGSAFTIQLSHLGATAKLVTIRPVVPFTCTEEFKMLNSEYEEAKTRGVFYRYIHVLPVEKIINDIAKHLQQLQQKN